MQHQALAVDILDSAKRGSDRSRLPVRTTNMSLPAIGETQKKTRTRQDFELADDPDEAFDIAALTEQANALQDSDPRRWPKLPGLSRDRINELENTIEDLRRELSARCIQIADLHNVQQQQATALVVARHAIEDLQNSAATLQETLTQREHEAMVAKQELLSSMQEKNTLNKKLGDMERETGALLQKLLHLTTALNDKEMAIISAEERVVELQQALTDKRTQDNIAQDTTAQNTPAPEPAPVAAHAIEEDKMPHSTELDETSIQFASLLERFDRMLSSGDEQINKLSETDAKLAKRYDTIDKSHNRLESQNRTLDSQIKKIEGTLAARDGQINKLSAANAKLTERFDTFDKSHAQLESQIKNLENRIKKVEGALAARDDEINELKETNTTLSERCDELEHSNVILESGHKHAQEKLKSQTSDIKLLEAALRAGRENAEQKIAELTGELNRERDEHFVAERESVTIREEIASLLSKLAATPRSVQ